MSSVFKNVIKQSMGWQKVEQAMIRGFHFDNITKSIKVWICQSCLEKVYWNDLFKKAVIFCFRLLVKGHQANIAYKGWFKLFHLHI